MEVFLQGDKTEKILPRQSAYIRKLVYQELPKHFKNKLQIETKTLENKDRVLVVKRFKSKEEQEKEEQSKISSEEAELKLCIGFSDVIKLIAQSVSMFRNHSRSSIIWIV